MAGPKLGTVPQQPRCWTLFALSEHLCQQINLEYIEQGLTCETNREQFAQAIERPLHKITDLINEATNQAGCKPDLIYMTGGSAKSLVIQQSIKQKFGDIEVVDGDHFDSVAAGLTLWAEKLFK